MSEEARLRERIVTIAKSVFDRGLTSGSSGSISARLSDGHLLVTPTGGVLGFLDPARLAKVALDGRLVAGDAPTKEMPLHSAFYDTRSPCEAVVHFHSAHSVALSTLPDVGEENVLPPLTAYAIMRLGRVKLLPYLRPGDPAMGEAVRALRGRRAAVLLANHGLVVAGSNLDSAWLAVEELEEGAKLALLTRGLNPRPLMREAIADLVRTFNVEWD